MYQLFAQKTMKNTPRGASRQGARSPREWCLASLTLSFAFANIVTLTDGQRNYDYSAEEKEVPIIINSAYRSPAVNRAVGGAATSNHLTGCAADIRCQGIEQAIRYAFILLDISDESQESFDELLIEQSAKSIWVHFAVRPEENRRKIIFLKG